MAAGEGAPRGQAAGRAVTSPARPDGQVVELVQGPADFVRYADQLGLDVERFNHHLRKHAGAQRIAEDVEGADLSGVVGTPTFFINGRRHFGAYDIAALSATVRGAGARANWRRPEQPSVARPPDSPSPSSVLSDHPNGVRRGRSQLTTKPVDRRGLPA